LEHSVTKGRLNRIDGCGMARVADIFTVLERGKGVAVVLLNDQVSAGDPTVG
jgi:hypothetical protein